MATINHKKFIKDLEKQLEALFLISTQSIYIYIDDVNKACNDNFSNLLGYDSPEEWASIKHSFTDSFVDEKSRATLADAYNEALDSGIASDIYITWIQKNGGRIATRVILIPMIYDKHFYAIHFVSSS